MNTGRSTDVETSVRSKFLSKNMNLKLMKDQGCKLMPSVLVQDNKYTTGVTTNDRFSCTSNLNTHFSEAFLGN